MSFQLLNKLYIVSRLLHIGDVVVLKSVDSTNQYLMDKLPNLKLGSVCLAETQTCGRGRYGKIWISPWNNNLYLSFYWLFVNDIQKKSILVLSLAISVVIGELLQKLGVKGISLKWPNDIYVSGRKLAGILVEVITTFHDVLHVVIGIGINVTKMLKYFECEEQVISLEEIGVFINRNILAINVINILYQALMQFDCFGFMPFFLRWLVLDNCYNQSVKLFVGDRIIFGVSRGVTSDGALLLECSGLIYSYLCTDNVSIRVCH